jgi:hypothetical protein
MHTGDESSHLISGAAFEGLEVGMAVLKCLLMN